ncbi:unnamed protein product [marine sediment metagenome]|uniref:Uncharacterized protein n=1 Tax=marine sediment metagenome TaxID=412755 RepID=X1P2W7_9ZZZZ
MDLVSVSRYFPVVDLFLIGVETGKRKDLNFDYKFKDEEKIALQKFIQQLAKRRTSKSGEISDERQLNLF